MGRLIRILRRCTVALLIGLLIGAGVTVWLPRLRSMPLPSHYQRKYSTFAHRALDFEAERYGVPDEDYELLDQIIASVQSRCSTATIVGDPRARERQVRQILKSVDDCLIENRFIFPITWEATLSEALAPHQLEATTLASSLKLPENARRRESILREPTAPVHLMACEQGALLYVGIAEALGVETRIVCAPRHAFCRARVGDDRWISWETNNGQSYSDDSYARSTNIAAFQIRDGIYLKTLSDVRVMSMQYTARAARCWSMGRHWDAADDFRKAIELDAKNPMAVAFMSEIYTTSPVGLTDATAAQTQGMALAKEGLALDASLPVTQEAFAAASAAAGDFPGALAAQRRVIDLGRPVERDEAQKRLAVFASGQTVIASIRAKRPISFWLVYDGGWRWCAAGLAIYVFLRVILSVMRGKTSTEDRLERATRVDIATLPPQSLLP